jgi:lysophospholipase L1-like esterase
VINGGTNDLRVYVGDLTAAEPKIVATVARNITAMSDIAQSHGVKVVLTSIYPIAVGHPELQRDPATILKINAWVKSFAATRGYPYVDYFAAVEDGSGAMPATMTADGLHPGAEGYLKSWSRLEAALRQLKLIGATTP